MNIDEYLHISSLWCRYRSRITALNIVASDKLKSPEKGRTNKYWMSDFLWVFLG